LVTQCGILVTNVHLGSIRPRVAKRIMTGQLGNTVVIS
jgi:hypothetical protein